MSKYGGPEDLELMELPGPPVGPDSVRVRVRAELVPAPVRTLARKPEALSREQAAGLPLAGLTARQCLKRLGLAEMARDKVILVHAASGGVGSMAVQLAAALGARVIGTASEHNHGYLRGLGAEPVTYGEGLADRVGEPAPDGVDAALDFVGGDAVEVSQEMLKNPGRVVSVVDKEVKEKGGEYLFVRPDPEDLAALAGLALDGETHRARGPGAAAGRGRRGVAAQPVRSDARKGGPDRLTQPDPGSPAPTGSRFPRGARGERRSRRHRAGTAESSSARATAAARPCQGWGNSEPPSTPISW